MIRSGQLDDDGRTLVVTRHLSAPIEDVWDSVTESERLSRWFGTWTGDPSTGSVMVTMTAEAEPAPPLRYDIDACERPHLLSVSAVNDFGHWKLTVELSESSSGTELVLRQEEVDPDSVGDLAPGWEWYLDRLLAAVAATPPPGLEQFETDYLPLGADYVALLRSPER